MPTPTPVVVNGDVSVILVDTAPLTANQSAVVLLSSIQVPGRTVTVRDSVGFLSSPQQIVVSTMAGVQFADGTSSALITQRFSYLTVTSRDPTSWNFTNTFGFPQNETVASVAGLTTSTITTSTLYVRNLISTTTVSAANLAVASTAQVFGPLYASTLVVAPLNPTFRPWLTDPGYAAYIQGNLKTYASLEVFGSAQFTNTISTGGNFTITGNISTLGSLGVRGDIQTLGNINAPVGGAFLRSLDILSSFTVGGPATFSNAITAASSLSVLDTLSTNLLRASTVIVGGTLQMGASPAAQIQNRGTDIFFTLPLTAPAISTNNLTASNAIVTSNLVVSNTIEALQASSIRFSSAVISNPSGSLLVSSLAAGDATFSSLATQVLSASTLSVSTLLFSGQITAAATGSVFQAGLGSFSTVSTGLFTAGELAVTGTISTTAFTTSSLVVTNSFFGNNLAVFQAQGTTIDNTGGSITTDSIFTRDTLATSTFTTLAGQLTSTDPARPLRIVAPLVTAPAASMSTLTTSSLTTSTLIATRITVGAGPPGPVGPTFFIDTLVTSTNVIVTGGPGDYLTPFTVSNVKPDEILPGDPYGIDVSFCLNWNGPQLPGYFATVPGLSLFPNGETASQLTLTSLNGSNTVTSLNGLTNTTQTFATDPNTGGISIPVGPAPSSFFRLTGTMVGNSALSFQFQSRSNALASAIDSNAKITFENGVLEWPYSLNGTTIRNSLNDMSVRNLYYYGSLVFSSDPALKENIEPADLERCAAAVAAVPVRRYRFKDFYLSTFQQRDEQRLGILATDLEAEFPKSIIYADLDCGAAFHSTIRMVDTQQLEMAHLGTTQLLASRVAQLTSTVVGLEAEIRALG